MRRLTTEELQGFGSEFEMTCSAQDGNGKAWMALWTLYKNMMMSKLIAVKGLTRIELESEALEVFADQLKRFDREKVSSETAYSMHSWLWCKVINRTSKLIRQRKRDVHLYFEEVNANSDSDSVGVASFNTGICIDGDDPLPGCNQMIGVNDEIYNTYAPEKMAIESLRGDDTQRVKAFYSKLTPFQRNILDARRQGMTLAEVAKRMRCSLSTIKKHVRQAKMCAEDVFQICYI